MIYYHDLPLSEDILKALDELKIEYVFQPIFYPDGKTIYAHEALMRPCGMNVTELIRIYQEQDRLHVLEVATFFGATQAFLMRGYKEKLSVNSFPCEIFTEEEVNAYIDYYGRDKTALIIEILEYPRFVEEIARVKRKVADISSNLIAIDDFGSGLNDYSIIDATQPDIVKIDRSMISNVDSDPGKQEACRKIIERVHGEKKLIVAEGIETADEFQCMKDLGADLFQGYYLAMPR
ncbi:MAG: EAL domain-containing protein [Lachnospiraceae bacterium]|nr:EAL domain-containing protein [Lachnospiraceae bacterium]